MPLFFLLLFFWPSSLHADNLEFCGKGYQPSFSFREVYVDHLDPKKRTQELWLDPADAALRGYWRKKDKKPLILIGNATESGRHFLCEYAWNGKKAQKLYFGTKTPEQITIDKQVFKRLHGMREDRDYMLKYELHTLVHDDPQYTEGPRCQALYAYFQIIAPQLTPGMKDLNSMIMDLTKGGIAMYAESRECQSRKAIPRNFNLAINVLFASDRFLSIKADDSLVAADNRDFNTRTINWDLQGGGNMDRERLLTKAERTKLLKFVKKRAVEIFGKINSLDDLESASFAFTAETLIVSLHPFIPTDIPITLDTLHQVLNIQGQGPIHP